jgi:hypothetical protein
MDSKCTSFVDIIIAWPQLRPAFKNVMTIQLACFHPLERVLANSLCYGILPIIDSVSLPMSRSPQLVDFSAVGVALELIA